MIQYFQEACDTNGISRGFGGGGGLFCELILENPEGMRGHRQNPFHGRVWIFSGTTHYELYSTQSNYYLTNGKRHSVYNRVMDARGRLLSTKEA